MRLASRRMCDGAGSPALWTARPPPAKLPGMEQKKNEMPGPRYALRLGDLRQWHVIEVRCFKCGKEGTVYPAVLLKGGRWTEHTRLVELEPRFRCRACGNRFGNSWNIMRLSRNA